MNFRKNREWLYTLQSYECRVISIWTVLDDRQPFAPRRWFRHNFPHEIHEKRAVVPTWNRTTVCESSQNPPAPSRCFAHIDRFFLNANRAYTRDIPLVVYKPINRYNVRIVDVAGKLVDLPIGTRCVKTGRPAGWALWLNRSARPLVVVFGDCPLRVHKT